jgi:hypothetical protein
LHSPRLATSSPRPERSPTYANEILAEARPPSYQASLAATIALSAARLAEVDPAALALLRLCAFLAPKAIPVDLLTTRPEPDPGNAGPPEEVAAWLAVLDKPVVRHRTIGQAGDYGLATITDEGIALHRLTQAILRDQLAGAAEAVRGYAYGMLAAAYPGEPDDPRTWPLWAGLLPHVLEADPAASDSPALRSLAWHAVWYQHASGDDHPGEQFADDLYRRWRERLGPDHPDTLAAANCLAQIYRRLARFRDARDLNEDTLARRRRIFGDDHPDTLMSANNFAVNLHDFGDAQAAAELDEDTLTRRRRVLGNDHPDTLTTANNLATNLTALGEVQAARKLNEDTLTRRRRILSNDHPQTLTTANNLATNLSALGEVQAARELNEDTLTRRRRTLGDDHPATQRSADNLAADRRALGEAD